jgi:hypothetical protein
MTTASNRLDSTISWLDAVLDQQTSRLEAVEARAALERDFARAQRMREAAEARREIQSNYADAFRAFGTETPAPVDDEAPSAYRRRLFNRLVRKLPPDHKLAAIRADDLGSQPIVLDNFEGMLLEAAAAEGASPSEANLPPDGTIIMRVRSDENTGGKFNEFFGTTSFIKEMGREGRKVAAIVDRRTGQAIWSRQAR